MVKGLIWGFVIGALLQSAASFSEEIDYTKYDIYYGDFNDDGDANDIYFHGKDIFVLIHNDVSVPLFVPGPEGFLFVEETYYSHGDPIPWSELTADMASYQQAVEGVDFFTGDLNGDGLNEVVIRGVDESSAALIVSLRNQSVEIIANVDSTGRTYSDTAGLSETSVFNKNLSNRNTSISISNSQLLVDALKFDLNPAEEFVAIDPTAIDENIASPNAPVLAQPNLSADVISKIDQVSTLGGAFRVSEGGEATYAIAIKSATGTAGVAPEVTLNYSSNSGRGLMGLGWNLGAGGSISRCRQTLLIDNVAKPITFSAEDRFCLDGQRLLLVSTDKVYGENGAKYKTEIDSFVTVTSHGGVTGSPDYFTMEARDGSTTYYGAQGADVSEYIPFNGTQAITDKVLSWGIRRFEDNIGNPIVYTYENNSDNYYLSEIRYAYGSETAEGAYAARMVFNYTTLATGGGYQSGYWFANKARLDSVESRGGADVILRSYQIKYNEGAANNSWDDLDRVTRILECDSQNNCLPATEFTWGQGTHAHLSPNSALSSVQDLGYKSDSFLGVQFGDFNGDGLLDVAYIQADKDHSGSAYADHVLRYAFQQSDGSYIRQTFTTGSSKYTYEENPYLQDEAVKISTVDINADGRTDIAVFRELHSRWELFVSKPLTDGTWKLDPVPLSDYSFPFTEEFVHFQDFNSDGLADAAYYLWGNLKIHYAERRTSGPINLRYTFASTPQEFNMPSGYRFTIQPELSTLDKQVALPVADFNNDGLVDFVGHKRTKAATANNGQCWESETLSIFLQQVDAAGNRSLSAPMVVDHYYDDYPLDTSPYENQGTYFDYMNQAACEYQTLQKHYNVFSPDINGDGATDVVWGEAYENNHTSGIGFTGLRYALGKGNGQFDSAILMPVGYGDNPSFVDYDGDGDTDLVWRDVNLSVGGQEVDDPIRLIRWDGNGFTPSTILLANEVKEASNSFIDMDSNGTPERVRLYNKNMYIDGGSDYLPSRQIVKIENGLGMVTEINYELLNKTEHYIHTEKISSTTNTVTKQIQGYQPFTVQETTLSYDDYYQRLLNPFADLDEQHSIFPEQKAPVLEYMGAVPLVTAVTSSLPSSSNPNNTARIDYYYREAFVQAAGRGLLGFKALTTVDGFTGFRTETEYRQDWPFIGTPIGTKVTTADGVVLKESESTPAIQGVKLTATDSGTDISTLRSQLASGGSKEIGPIQVYTHQTIDREFDFVNNGADQGGELSWMLTKNKLDAYGNVVEVILDTFAGGSSSYASRVITTNEYGSDTWSQEKGRLSKSTVESLRPGKPTKTRSSEFYYVGVGNSDCEHSLDLYGMLCKEVTSPDSPSDRVETEHFYDAFGNAQFSKSVSASGTRVSSYVEFDSRGRYQVRSYGLFSSGAATSGSVSDSRYNTAANEVGASVQLVEEVISRDKHGAATESISYIDADSTVTKKIWLTPFGAQYFSATSAGAYSQTVASREDLTNCPAQTVYSITSSSAGGSMSKTCFDMLGRELRKMGKSFDGSTWAANDTQYNDRGQVARKSTPYHLGGTAYWTDIVYDDLGRQTIGYLPINTVDANGNETTVRAQTSTTYSGFDKTETNPKGQTKTETVNALGELVQVTTVEGTTQYGYDAHGNLTTMTDAANNTTYVYYDDLGRKSSMNDPDKGSWSYKYNAFGDLVCQQDAKGQIIENDYDFAGRLISRLDREAGGSCDNPTGNIVGQAQWVHDTAPNGLGQLDWEQDHVSDFVRRYTYDTFGRRIQTNTEFPGVNGEASSHFEKVVYDEFGRIFQTFDAARNSASFKHNGVQTHYNASGFLSKLTDVKNQGGAAGASDVYYEVEAMDPFGNVTAAKMSNNVIATGSTFNVKTGLAERITATAGMYTRQDIDMRWDHVGNLIYRHEHGVGSGTSSKNIRESFTYDNVNRLKTYSVSAPNTSGHTTSVNYNNLGNIIYKSDVGSSNYQYGSSRPHAVTSAGGVTYNYDANGSMVQDTKGRNLTYSVFDKVTDITVNGKHRTEFSYDTGRSRFKRVDTPLNASNQAASGSTTTLYVGGVEKLYHPDGSAEWRRTIGGVALITHKFDAAQQQTKETRYLLKDHLGSTNYILDALGNVDQELAFDPWGARRNTGSWVTLDQATLDTVFAVASQPITSRGFTGHEMLDESGIIHMNGRIYDAHLGRFLQADPFIQEPTTPGSLNRYSYVMNNPLNATDPSGYIGVFIEIFALAYLGSKNEALGQVIGLLGSIAAGMVCGPGCAAAWYGMYQGALAKRNGHSSRDAFKSGVNAGITSFIQGAVFSGIGGEFKGKGGFFKYGTKGGFWHITAHATAGGVFSAMQGGKFGHGFVSAGITKGIMSNVMGATGKHTGVMAKTMRTMLAAAIGGTISERSGGKFVNGAVTAAFAHLFNAEESNTEEQAAQKGLTQEQMNNMSPADVVKYWASGKGGDLYFGPDSKMSKLFSQGDGAKLLEDLFYQKFGGSPPNLGKMDRVDYRYTWDERALNTNLAVQVVGTWKGHAVRANDQVLFRAENSMSIGSLTFGRQRAELAQRTGWSWIDSSPRASDVNMTIEWSRPLRQ